MENTPLQSIEPENSPKNLAPVNESQRIDLMDILRGFALIGILMMNIEWFNRAVSALGTADLTLTNFDHAAGWLVRCFVEGKFYKLFALLFGMGFTIMLLRAKEVDRPFGAWFSRRMLVLMTFGLLHLFFLWSGDILHDYAFSGLVFLGWITLLKKPRFQKYDNPRSFLKIGLVWLSIPMIMPLIAAIGFGVTFDRQDLQEHWQKQQKITAQAEIIKADLINEQKITDELAELSTNTQDEDGIALTTADSLSDIKRDGIVKLTDDTLATQSSDETSEANTDNKLNEDSVTDEDALAGEEAELTEEEEIALAAQEIAEAKFEFEQKVQKEDEVYSSGTYWQATQQRFEFAGFILMVMPGFAFFMLLPIFFIGYWLIASGKIKNHQQHRSFYDQLFWVGGFGGLFITVAGLTIINHPAAENVDTFQGVGNVLFMAGQYLMAGGYLGLIVRMIHSEKWHKRLSKLAPMGRMALTNYIMQSVIQVSLFYGYGAGLYGHVGRASQIGIVVGIIILQMIFSSWWLSRYKFGPLEWLWRSLTYKEFQPMKLSHN